MTLNHKIASILCFLFALTLSGCVSSTNPGSIATSASSSARVTIIGKVELSPPLDTEFEQTTRWNVIGDEATINKVAIAIGDNPIPVDKNRIRFSQWKNSLKVELGKTFVRTVSARTTYFKDALIQLDIVDQDVIWLPGGLYFEVPEGANTVYIGTLRYTRGTFNVIKNVEVIDQYEQAKAAVSSDAVKAPMVKSLLKFARRRQ